MSETPGSFITTGTTTDHGMDDVEWLRVSRLARVRFEIRATPSRCFVAIMDAGTFEIIDEMREIGLWLIAHAPPVASNDTTPVDLAIEQRAAWIFAAIARYRPHSEIMTIEELAGWNLHASYAGSTSSPAPTCDAEWAGWLAREIHYTNAREQR